MQRLQESEDASAEDEDSYDGLPVGIELRACPRCKVKIEKNEGCSAMTCYRCGEGFTWASATLIKAKPRKPTTTLRLAALAAATWVSDSVPALRGLAFAVGEDGRLTVESGDAKAPPSGPDLTPLTLEAARALPQGTRVVLLEEYSSAFRVAAGTVGISAGTSHVGNVVVNFPEFHGACPPPSVLSLAPPRRRVLRVPDVHSNS